MRAHNRWTYTAASFVKKEKRTTRYLKTPPYGHPAMISSIRIVGLFVDRDDDREDEAIIFAREGLDAVRVA